MRRIQHLTGCCSPPPPSFLIQGILWAGGLGKRMSSLLGGSRSEWQWNHLLAVIG